MKKIISFLTFLFIAMFAFCKGGINFASYFKNKTMRLDYFHSGNFQQERFAVDKIWSDGAWGGSRTILVDQLNLGLYQFEIRDKKSNTLLYSRGFASIFGEWQTIPEAKKEWGTFHESVRFPWPERPVKLIMKKRDKENIFQSLWQTDIDPDSRLVNPADRVCQNRLFKLRISGPAETKVDLVVLGDGYTEAEMDKFVRDSRRLTATLMNTEPYRSRRSDFNIRAIFTPSATSGVSKPHPGIFKRSPLSTHYSSFDSERYVLTYDNRTVRDIAGAVPYEFMIILVNEKTYGGGGIYRLYATVSADNEFSDYIVIHEMGHHLGALADEYYSASVSYEVDNRVTVEPWELNVTALLDKSTLKWKDLVKKDTPLPTPWNKKEFDEFSRKIQAERQRLRKARADEKELEKLFKYQRETEQKMFAGMQYHGTVGAFEGAAYLSRGLYRSSTDCIMFTRNLKFCPVCVRALNLVIDQYTR